MFFKLQGNNDKNDAMNDTQEPPGRLLNPGLVIQFPDAHSYPIKNEIYFIRSS
jgi:hypothetical protein